MGYLQSIIQDAKKRNFTLKNLEFLFGFCTFIKPVSLIKKGLLQLDFPLLSKCDGQLRKDLMNFIILFLSKKDYKSNDGKALWPKFVLDMFSGATACM